MTLQDVIDEVVKNPQKYGRGEWWDEAGAPFCPLAVMLRFTDVEGTLDPTRRAAQELECSEFEIKHFLDWWDEGRRLSHEALKRAGFILPSRPPTYALNGDMTK